MPPRRCPRGQKRDGGGEQVLPNPDARLAVYNGVVERVQ
jgi:hypothetical protein